MRKWRLLKRFCRTPTKPNVAASFSFEAEAASVTAAAQAQHSAEPAGLPPSAAWSAGSENTASTSSGNAQTKAGPWSWPRTNPVRSCSCGKSAAPEELVAVAEAREGMEPKSEPPSAGSVRSSVPEARAEMEPWPEPRPVGSVWSLVEPVEATSSPPATENPSRTQGRSHRGRTAP